jgi:hypothetical protein
MYICQNHQMGKRKRDFDVVAERILKNPAIRNVQEVY